MKNKEYLLDTNIVIKTWKQYPRLFEAIENTEGIDFKLYHHIAAELSIKEFKDINGVPVLSDKFLKLLGHIIKEEEIECEEINRPNISIKHDVKKQVYTINGNKLSKNDYNLICLCENYENYILVTEDKGLITSGKLILEPSRVMTFKEFICDLEKFNIL